jgi:hypothetical protein
VVASAVVVEVAEVDAAVVVAAGAAVVAGGRSRAGKSPKPKSRIPNPKALEGVLGFFLDERGRLSGRVGRLDQYGDSLEF